MAKLNLKAEITDNTLESGDPLAKAMEIAIRDSIGEIWHVIIDRNFCIAAPAFPESRIEKLNECIVINGPSAKPIVRARIDELKVGDAIEFNIYTSK